MFIMIAVLAALSVLTGCASSSNGRDSVNASAPELSDSEVLALMLAQGYDIYNPRFSVSYNGRTIYGPARAIEEKIAQSGAAAEDDVFAETGETEIPDGIPEAADGVPEPEYDTEYLEYAETGFAEGDPDTGDETGEQEVWDPLAEDPVTSGPAVRQNAAAGIPAERDDAVWEDIPAVADNGYGDTIAADDMPDNGYGDAIAADGMLVYTGETISSDEAAVIVPSPGFTFHPETGDAAAVCDTCDEEETAGAETVPGSGPEHAPERLVDSIDWNLVLGILSLLIVWTLAVGRRKRKTA